MTALNLTGITINEFNGYGKVQYGNSTDYSTSTVKQVVDAWKNSAVTSDDTVTARLITFDEVHQLGYGDEPASCGGTCQYYTTTVDVPAWVYNRNYNYWTESLIDSKNLWFVNSNSSLSSNSISNFMSVRPVLELNKSADITKLTS